MNSQENERASQDVSLARHVAQLARQMSWLQQVIPGESTRSSGPGLLGLERALATCTIRKRQPLVGGYFCNRLARPDDRRRAVPALNSYKSESNSIRLQ